MKSLFGNQLLNDEQLNSTLASLDESQYAAATSEEPKIVIRAPAGSGKTTTLLAAIVNYKYDHVNDRICAITYTRAARAEMEVRLQQKGVYDVEVTTIHVWARNILYHFSKKYDFKIRILEENQIKDILKDLVADYLKTHKKIRYINIDILYNFIFGNKKMDVSEIYRSTLNALEKRYLNYKSDNELYDFTDYPLYLYNVMKAYNEEVNDIDALFVDEFQDVDPIQFEIFKLVNAKKKFYIGDPWQSIYQFRNADGKIFEKLQDFTCFKLKMNYRSHQEIIDYATTVYQKLYSDALLECDDTYINKITELERSKIVCSRAKGSQIYLLSPFEDMTKINDDTKCSPAESFFLFLQSNPMILCRTNKQVSSIKQYGYFDVDTVHQAKGLEYDNVLVIDTMISGLEDLNIAYVALTRAKNNLFVINWSQFENLFKIYMNSIRFGG